MEVGGRPWKRSGRIESTRLLRTVACTSRDERVRRLFDRARVGWACGTRAKEARHQRKCARAAARTSNGAHCCASARAVRGDFLGDSPES